MYRTVIALGFVATLAVPLHAADEPKDKEPAAAELLAGSVAKAKKDNKLVFLLFGSPG
jgi:hypothetical protein